MNILWKILAVLAITAGWAALTCGGNIVVLNVVNISIDSFLGYFWFIEIFSIFIWTIYKFFFHTTTWSSQSIFMKEIIFLVPILWTYLLLPPRFKLNITAMKSFLENIFKLLTAFILTFIWALITCGGNILIMDTKFIKWLNEFFWLWYSEYFGSDIIWIIWYIEIAISFWISLWITFMKKWIPIPKKYNTLIYLLLWLLVLTPVLWIFTSFFI